MLLSGSNVKITSVSNSVVISQPTKGKTLLVFSLHSPVNFDSSQVSKTHLKSPENISGPKSYIMGS